MKNSAIGSKAGAVFGNQINILSATSNQKSIITPFTVESNVLLTDEIRRKSNIQEPENKKKSRFKILLNLLMKK